VNDTGDIVLNRCHIALWILQEALCG